jgi:anti-sigma factor ChrR (cupin superfamily)
MSRPQEKRGCDQTERVALHALGALPRAESDALQTHIDSCAECRRELDGLRPVVESLASWPTDVLRPANSLWDRLAQRVAVDSGTAPLPVAAALERPEPEWEEVGPGISCKLLATDSERHRVSMLVRLAPGADYPPHSHADIEELHLLAGELWIDNRKLHPGDYNRAEPGTRDERVWSETGCTCVLITSFRDALN